MAECETKSDSEMTSRGFCAHGNVATVIGNKGRAPIVC